MQYNPLIGNKGKTLNEKKVFILTMRTHSSERFLVTKGNEAGVMEYVVGIKTGEMRKVENIKSIDIHGNVEDYEIVFEGILLLRRLEPKPQEERLTYYEWESRHNKEAMNTVGRAGMAQVESDAYSQPTEEYIKKLSEAVGPPYAHMGESTRSNEGSF